MLIAGVFFVFGFVVSAQLNSKTNFNNFVDQEAEVENQQKELLKTNENEISKEVNDGWVNDLAEADKIFLEEHVYGQWKFSERLFALDESNKNMYYNKAFNFSDQGVEIIKDIVISYYEDSVRKVTGAGQTSFSNIQDLYLYAEYGGLNAVRLPVYHVEYEIDAKNIELQSIYALEENYIQYPDKERLIKVYYDLGYNEYTNPAIMSKYLGNILYVDPSDTDTLYLDFCGFWELKRDNNNYSTNGKQYDSGW